MINSNSAMSNHPFDFPLNSFGGMKFQFDARDEGCGICALVLEILKQNNHGTDPVTMWHDPTRDEQRSLICFVKMAKYGYFFADQRGERKEAIRRISLHIENPCTGEGGNTGPSNCDVEFAILPEDANLPTLTAIRGNGGAGLRANVMKFAAGMRDQVELMCDVWLGGGNYVTKNMSVGKARSQPRSTTLT